MAVCSLPVRGNAVDFHTCVLYPAALLDSLVDEFYFLFLFNVSSVSGIWVKAFRTLAKGQQVAELGFGQVNCSLHLSI